MKTFIQWDISPPQNPSAAALIQTPRDFTSRTSVHLAWGPAQGRCSKPGKWFYMNFYTSANVRQMKRSIISFFKIICSFGCLRYIPSSPVSNMWLMWPKSQLHPGSVTGATSPFLFFFFSMNNFIKSWHRETTELRNNPDIYTWHLRAKAVLKYHWPVIVIRVPLF